jgi:TolA-binding protein
LAIVSSAGCGGELARAELADVRKKLEETQRREASSQQKVDELENRVFLLTDQVESAKVAASRVRAARLPVVTLRPGDDGDMNGGDDIEYDGAARRRDVERTRPSLRLEGHASAHVEEPPRLRRSVTLASADSSSREPDNLGVAPAPPISRADDMMSVEPPRKAAPQGPPPAIVVRPLKIKDAPPPPATDPLDLYNASYEQLRSGQHDAAAAGFRDFVRRYPQHDYADNAQYWFAETFYARKQYAAGGAGIPRGRETLSDGQQGARCTAQARLLLAGAGRHEARQKRARATAGHVSAHRRGAARRSQAR